MEQHVNHQNDPGEQTLLGRKSAAFGRRAPDQDPPPNDFLYERWKQKCGQGFHTPVEFVAAMCIVPVVVVILVAFPGWMVVLSGIDNPETVAKRPAMPLVTREMATMIVQSKSVVGILDVHNTARFPITVNNDAIVVVSSLVVGDDRFPISPLGLGYMQFRLPYCTSQ